MPAAKKTAKTNAKKKAAPVAKVTKEEKNTAPKKESKKTTIKAVSSDDTVRVKRIQKKEVIAAYRKHEKDTGSAYVQVAILTERILSLTEHLKTHAKDNNSRRGLLMMVNKRRKLLTYVKRKSPEKYQELIDQLGLRN